MTARKQSGYLYCHINDKAYFAHRLAWLMQTGEQPPRRIVHIDGDKSNNRWSNLRAAEPGEKRQREEDPHVYKVDGGWQAKTEINGDTIYLGVYKRKKTAQEAVDLAEKTARGKL